MSITCRQTNKNTRTHTPFDDTYSMSPFGAIEKAVIFGLCERGLDPDFKEETCTHTHTQKQKKMPSMTHTYL
jgi:hypothetical protein